MTLTVEMHFRARPDGRHGPAFSIKSGQQIYGQTDSCSEKLGMRLHLPLNESFKKILTEKLSEQSVLPPRKLLWNIGITGGFTRLWRQYVCTVVITQ